MPRFLRHGPPGTALKIVTTLPCASKMEADVPRTAHTSYVVVVLVTVAAVLVVCNYIIIDQYNKLNPTKPPDYSEISKLSIEDSRMLSIRCS